MPPANGVWNKYFVLKIWLLPKNTVLIYLYNHFLRQNSINFKLSLELFQTYFGTYYCPSVGGSMLKEREIKVRGIREDAFNIRLPTSFACREINSRIQKLFWIIYPSATPDPVFRQLATPHFFYVGSHLFDHHLWSIILYQQCL